MLSICNFRNWLLGSAKILREGGAPNTAEIYEEIAEQMAVAEQESTELLASNPTTLAERGRCVGICEALYSELVNKSREYKTESVELLYHAAKAKGVREALFRIQGEVHE